MTEALRMICFWALDQGNVKRIKAQSELDNVPSHRVLEKCRFIRKSEVMWKKTKMNATSDSIIIKELDLDDLSETLFDHFNRYQDVKKMLAK